MLILILSGLSVFGLTVCYATVALRCRSQLFHLIKPLMDHCFDDATGRIVEVLSVDNNYTFIRYCLVLNHVRELTKKRIIVKFLTEFYIGRFQLKWLRLALMIRLFLDG